MRADELHAADSQSGDVESRLADADRNALSALAARADAFVQLEIVAHHGDARERAGAVADQGRALDRIFDRSVLDKIGFRALEDELAGGDVDLSASEIDRIYAALEAF